MDREDRPSKTMTSVIAIGRIVWFISLFLSVIFFICFMAIPLKHDSDGVVIRDNSWAFICFAVSLGIAVLGAAIWDGIDGGTNYDSLEKRLEKLEKIVLKKSG